MQETLVPGAVHLAQKSLAGPIEPAKELTSFSVAETARMLNVSESSVKRAKTVLQHGTPEEIKSVEQGEAEGTRL